MKMKSRKIFILLLLAGLCQVGLANSGSENSTKWKPLFGKNMDQSKFKGDSWTVENGVLTASEDEVIWAYGQYENFVLDLEFKNAEGTNSGVIVYCTDMDNWIPNSVEIQIADDHSEKWGTSRKDYQCGAIFGHLPANKQKVVKKPGEWNRFTITCKGQDITVKLNGKVVTKMDMSLWTSGTTNPDGTPIPSWLPTPFAELPTKGFIGLQGKHGDATIWFRNVRIKEL
jgi:hypothetical protein